MLSQPDLTASFVDFCKSQHSEENVQCWLAIRDFKCIPRDDQAGLRAGAAAIVSKVGPNADVVFGLVSGVW